MTTDFLLELRSEEIPARMQDKARQDLAALFEGRLNALNLAFDSIESYATPRRLALIVRGVAEATTAMTEERKGPRADAPAQAIEGFLRSTGLTRDQLVARDDGKGGQVLFAVVERPGVVAGSVLASAIAHAIHAFAWPKSMRWGAASISTESLRWVRPLQGIVALLGDKLVPVEIAGIKSGAATVGHRFHHPGVITIGSANDYVEKLRACHVIVDQEERKALIRTRAAALAAEAGLELIEDEGLVSENAGLTEWPVPLLGRFDPEFLSVPPEVIQLTARVNQKYFVCRGADGKLANAFVCTANIEAADGGAKIVEGNRKVLAARLSDARFFYETDLKVPLVEQAKKLEKIVFHEKLGTVADKVDRVAKLARWLIEEGIIKSSPARGGGPRSGGGGSPQATPPAATPLHHQPAAGGPPPRAGEDLAALAERAARLCKADLVTGMVGEFPELQGLIGGYYAAAQGEDPQVAEAIRDHYKPVGQGDEVPTAPVTVAVSLADKLDTIINFFAADLRPSGSRDPFALRRGAISILSQLEAKGIRLHLTRAASIPLLVRAQREKAKLNTLQSEIRRVVGSENKAEKIINLDTDSSEYLDLTENSEDLRRLAIQLRNVSDTVSGISAVFDNLDPFLMSIVDFFADRLKVQQREAGVRHDLIDAVFALGGEDDLVRLLARVHALQAFVATEDGKNLLAGYKRAANILKKENYAVAPAKAGASSEEGHQPHEIPASAGMTGSEKPLSYTPEIEEAALISALDSAEPLAAAAIAREDFEGAMAALAGLRAPIDAFFDKVTVNDPQEEKREARLALLARMRDAVHRVADFSKIEG